MAAQLFQTRLGAVIRVTGEDAFSFLQGQFSNELRQPAGAALYGLWLNQKGKVLADSHVLRLGENEFLIVSALSSAGVIMGRLQDYVVADDVTLTDETLAIQGAVLAGGSSMEMFRLLTGSVPQADNFLQVADVMVFRGRRTPDDNLEIIGPRLAVEKVCRQLLASGATEGRASSMETDRIAAGIPSIPLDVGPGDLPNEGGLETTAISYTKGCYLGQEVMARLKNLGQVRRRLHIVRGPGNPPPVLNAIYQGDTKIGELRSVASRGDEFVALAMLSLINLQPQLGLSLAPGGPPDLVIVPHGRA